MTETKKPKLACSESQKQLDKMDEQFKDYEANINDLTLDRMNEAPKQDVEAQTKIARKDMDKMNDVYLKPLRTISSREKFNETYREDYNFSKEYVKFIAENKEIGGESIDMWTKPYPGLPAENWIVPVGKPVWGPIYLAEQITKAKYHRLVMQQNINTGADHMAQYYGNMVVDTTIQRLDAIPVNYQKKSIFMGAI